MIEMKKNVIVTLAAAAAMLVLSSCAGTYQKGKRMPESTSAQIDTVSYALGMYYGRMLTSSPFGELNLAQVRKGFYDVINGKEVKLSEIGTFEMHVAPMSIERENRQYVLLVQCDYKGDMGRANDVMESKVENFSKLLPLGYTIRYGMFFNRSERTKTTALVLLVIIGIIFHSIGRNRRHIGISIFFLHPRQFAVPDGIGMA